MHFTSNDGSQNTFVYQPVLDTLKLKKDRGTEYILNWKSKGEYNSKLKPIYTTFLHSIKISGYRMEIKFEKYLSAVEQNNYLTKIINVYIVSDLELGRKNPTNNFKLRNCLFHVTNTVKYSDKEKYLFSGYGKTFESAGFWSFNNDSAKNVITFGVDNSPLSHADNRKNNFLVLGVGPTFGINGIFGSAEKKFSVSILVKQTRNFG